MFFVQKGGIILVLFFLSNPKELARWEEVKCLVAREVAGVLIDAVGGTLPPPVQVVDICPCCKQEI